MSFAWRLFVSLYQAGIECLNNVELFFHRRHSLEYDEAGHKEEMGRIENGVESLPVFASILCVSARVATPNVEWVEARGSLGNCDGKGSSPPAVSEGVLE